jgi:hypothetical protein
VSGWERPTPPAPDGPAPRSYWSQPEADSLGPGQLIRRGWRLYRSTPRRFLLIAAISGSLQTLLALPTLTSAVLLAQGLVDVMADYLGRIIANPEAYRYTDQQALQVELEARFRAVLVPGTDLAALSAVGAGLGGAIGLIGTAALTATALSVAVGRPIPVAFAFRLVAARAGLIKPIVALGLGWMAVSWLSVAVQASPDIQAWAGAAGSPRSVLLGSLLSVLALVVVVGIIVFAVRWALFIPAVLVEALGVGPGLARAAQLTRGIRIRLGLAMAGIFILHALSVGIGATVVGFVAGLLIGSVAVGFGAYLIASLIGNLLWAPLLPAMLALAYRERTRDAETSATVRT